MRRFALLALSFATLVFAPAPSAVAAPGFALPPAGGMATGQAPLPSPTMASRPALTPAAAATEAAHQAAMQGYLYFYPLVTMDLMRRQFTHPSRGADGAPANRFQHGRSLPQPGAATPWANPDMLRSTAWVDLTAGPVVVTAPDAQGRLYTLTLVDMWTDVFATLGPRTTGSAKRNTVIVPPGWSGTLPSGMTRLDAPTAHVWAKILVRADSAADLAAVHALQDGFTLTPLAQWNLPAQSQRVLSDPNLDMKTPVREQVESMPTDAFFTYAAELLRKHPAHVTDQPVLAQLRRAGLVAGRTFDFDKLDHPAKQGMRRGLRAGRERMEAAAGNTLRSVNGWQQETGSVGVYGNDYLRRALAAQAQPGASLPEDLTVLLLAADQHGAPIDGAQRYTLHLQAGQLPPAGAFWSLAAYDGQGMPVTNVLNRYTLGDRSPLVYNADGSLDVWVSATPPDAQHQPNWLPIAAAGPVTLLLRVYEPEPALLDGLWTPPLLVPDAPPLAPEVAPQAQGDADRETAATAPAQKP